MTNDFYDEKLKNDFEKPKNNYYIHRERGGCLSTFLAAIIGLNTFAILALCAPWSEVSSAPPTLIPIIIVVTMFIQGGVIACAIAIWNWKKWGIYGLASAYIIQIALMLRAGDSDNPSIVSSIVGLLILILLVNYRMDLFD